MTVKKFNSFTIICAAGKRSSAKSSMRNISESMNINFINQMNLAIDLKKIRKIKKIVFFSSFNIFRKTKIRDIGYYLSKKNMFEITKNDKSGIFQCYVMGNISTKMNEKHPSLIKSIPIIGTYMESKISIGPNHIAKHVINNLNKKISNVFFFPLIPLLLIKIIIFFLELINKVLYRKS